MTPAEITESGEPEFAGAKASEYAFGRLREAIMSGELPAGSELSQVQLSKDLGISRTPLREAVRRLQQEGLLEGEANHRVRVAAAELDDFDTLCAVRVINEALAIRITVPRLAEAEVDRIDSLRLKLEAARDQSAEEWWTGCHIEFHRALLIGAKGRIKATLDSAYDHAIRFVAAFDWWIPSFNARLSPELREHAELMDAVRARDSQLCAEILARHHARGALELMNSTDPLFNPVAVRNALALVLRQPSRS